MDKNHLVTSNLEKKFILLTFSGPICNEAVRQIREELAPLLALFDEPVSLVIDLREAEGSQLDALDELKALWATYEQAAIGQIIRIFANDEDDQGSKISDYFHLKNIRKINVTRMRDAIRHCESFAGAS